MQNRINKIIDVCIKNDFTEIKIKERRTYFIDIICQNVLAPNKINDEKIEQVIKKIFSKKVENEISGKRNTDVLEQLKYVKELLNETGIDENYLNTDNNREKVTTMAIKHCLGKRQNSELKIKDIFYNGLRNVAFSNQDAELAWMTYNKRNKCLTKQEMIELFNKAKNNNLGKMEWYNIIVNIPKNKNLMDNQKSIMDFTNCLTILNVDDGYSIDIIKSAINNIRLNNQNNWNEISEEMINALFDGRLLDKNHAVLTKEILRKRTGSPGEIFIKSHKKNLYNLFSDIINGNYSRNFIKEEYKELLSFCIEQDKIELNKSMSITENEVNKNSHTSKKRI